MKAGYKTTEFWMAIVAIIAKYFFPDDFPTEAFYAVAGYGVSRGIAKLTAKGGGS